MKPRSRGSVIGLGLFITLLYVFLLAPIAVIVVEAFNSTDLLVFPPRGWSLRWFVAFAHNSGFLNSFQVSLELAALTAVLATLVGTPAAYGLVRFRKRHQSAVETLLLSPIYVPQVLIGMALLIVFSTIALAGSFTGMAIAHLLITTPYVVRSVAVSLEGVSRTTEEAARSLGASRWQAFFRVTVPQMRSGVLAGAIFAFVISFADIYMALFLAGPRTTTLPLRIFSFMQWSQSPLIAAVSTVQIALVIGIFVVAEKAIRFSKQGRI